MKLVDARLMDSLTLQAKSVPRRRAHHNLHLDLNESVHRLCIAVEPGSYVRPHRHFMSGQKWEFLTILRGKISVLTFDEAGVVSGRYDLDEHGDLKALELSPDILHTFVSMESGAIVLEVKQGPYIPPSESDCSSWAPKEGEANAEEVERWYRTAKCGDKYKN